ncbi:MAG: hypothetical protein HDS35_04645 [Bacteroides sp.]|nr:hypothetical protein [Bacteroides sp.]
MKKPIVTFLIICPAMMVTGQIIRFSYDSSGNRISRKFEERPKPPNPPKPSQDITPFGISELALLESRVYPVPVKETLTVEIATRMYGSPVTVTLIDGSGQILKTIITSEAKVEIGFNSYPRGVYNKGQLFNLRNEIAPKYWKKYGLKK